jgi:hypothetical protein
MNKDRSRWEQQVSKDVNTEGRLWEGTEEEELWIDRDRWRGLVVRQDTFISQVYIHLQYCKKSFKIFSTEDNYMSWDCMPEV